MPGSALSASLAEASGTTWIQAQRLPSESLNDLRAVTLPAGRARSPQGDGEPIVPVRQVR
jgi:hypothetical protein